MSLDVEGLGKRVESYQNEVEQNVLHGPNGKFYEEFLVGAQIHHDRFAVIGEEDNLLFCVITENHQPIHTRPDIAIKMGFDETVINGLFGLSLVVGLSLEETTADTVCVNVGYDQIIQFDAISQTARLRIGDRITASTEVVETRPSSNPLAPYGIVKLQHIGYRRGPKDAEDVIFTRFFRTARVYTKEGYEERLARSSE